MFRELFMTDTSRCASGSFARGFTRGKRVRRSPFAETPNGLGADGNSLSKVRSKATIWLRTAGELCSRRLRCLVCSPLPHEVPDELGNLICCGIEREMARLEDVDFGLGHVLAVAFRFAEVEREIILTPNHQ